MYELLLRRKTSSRGLGTVEALMSVMGDMQALVMELKNLVEQCLAAERAVQVHKGRGIDLSCASHLCHTSVCFCLFVYLHIHLESSPTCSILMIM